MQGLLPGCRVAWLAKWRHREDGGYSYNVDGILDDASPHVDLLNLVYTWQEDAQSRCAIIYTMIPLLFVFKQLMSAFDGNEHLDSVWIMLYVLVSVIFR